MTTQGFLAARLLLACAFVVAAVEPSAHAGARRGATKSEDEQLIQQGLDLRDKGQDDAALELFRRAYKVSATGRAAAQMALAEQALGHWVDAEAHLTEALRADEPWIVRNKTLLTQALTDIRSHIGSLDLVGGAAGAEVVLNGQTVGTLPLGAPLRAPAGSVALEVRAPGYLPVVRNVVVPSGGTARETLSMVSLGQSPAVPESAAPVAEGAKPAATTSADGSPPISDESGSLRRPIGLALGIAGVAGLGVGTGFYIAYRDRSNDFNKTPCYASLPMRGGSGCQVVYDGIIHAQVFSILGFTAGALAIAAGVYLFTTGSRPADERRGDGAPPMPFLARALRAWHPVRGRVLRERRHAACCACLGPGARPEHGDS